MFGNGDASSGTIQSVPLAMIAESPQALEKGETKCCNYEMCLRSTQRMTQKSIEAVQKFTA